MGIFGTVVMCMDGRTQIPVNEWMRNRYQIDYVDTITEAGPSRILAEHEEKTTLDSVKKRLDISLKRHGSRVVAVVSHHDCAGNPAPKDIQIKHTERAIQNLKNWGIDATFVGLWVDENWKVHEIVGDN